jgi:hypothetical protein
MGFQAAVLLMTLRMRGLRFVRSLSGRGQYTRLGLHETVHSCLFHRYIRRRRWEGTHPKRLRFVRPSLPFGPSRLPWIAPTAEFGNGRFKDSNAEYDTAGLGL